MPTAQVVLHVGGLQDRSHGFQFKFKSRQTVKKWVYFFGAGKAEGDGTQKPLLGGKGAGLAEMSRIGLPVPPGFTITTEVCTYYYGKKKSYPKELDAQVKSSVGRVEKIMGTKFGDKSNMPLLVSVRSGARDSMPGMMDTILNLGLNDQTVVALANATKNERFAWDCYRRFIQLYGDVVMGVQKRTGEDHEPFEVVIHPWKQLWGAAGVWQIGTHSHSDWLHWWPIMQNFGRQWLMPPSAPVSASVP